MAFNSFRSSNRTPPTAGVVLNILAAMILGSEDKHDKGALYSRCLISSLLNILAATTMQREQCNVTCIIFSL
ncbi:MAG: hypothetical protein GY820_30220 [Gammaproteobacteria bacterium]|nr:hypothetical protein [Gammaproteobacteria bacterium]